mgnify:CR=1 FL=1
MALPVFRRCLATWIDAGSTLTRSELVTVVMVIACLTDCQMLPIVVVFDRILYAS